MNYYSNFPKGFQNLIIKILTEVIPDVNLISSGDDFVAFTSNISIDRIKQLEFFEQTFLILKLDEKGTELKSLIGWFSRSPELIVNVLRSAKLEDKAFRLVGTSYRLSNGEIQKLLNSIRTKIQISSSQPDHDIRFVEKKTHSFIGIRITSSRESRDNMQFGSLRKEVAYMMLYLSEMDRNDVFIDPFAGNGLIPILRSKLHPYKSITASDREIAGLKGKMQQDNSLKGKINMIQAEIHEISQKNGQKFNKVVTDPPWGMIEKIDNLDGFYSSMLDDIYEMTNENAKVIMLTPHLDIISKYLERRCKSFELLDTFFGFVSGKEVNIVKLKRLY